MSERHDRAGQVVLELLGPSTGGIRRHVVVLAGGLEARGWSAPIAGPSGVLGAAAPGRDVDHVVPVPDLTPRGLLRMPAAALALRRALRRTGASVVHAHGLKAAAVAIAARTGRPLVVTVHNVVLDVAAGRAAPILRALEGRLPAGAAATIAVSDEIGRRFAESGHSAVVIPPAGELPQPRRGPEAVRRAHGVPTGAPLVVCAARLHPQKGVDVLLAAFAEVVRRRPEARLVVIGDGPDRAVLERLAGELGVAGAVRLAGASEHAADELAAADVVVIPSRWESGPLVLVEAMHLGAAIVATDVGFVRDLVGGAEPAGEVVPPEDPAALAAAIEALVSDGDRRARLGAAARRRVAERYDPEALVDRVAAVLRATISGP